MASARKKLDDVTALEYSTMRVPYENLNCDFRASQKSLERAQFRYAKEGASVIKAEIGEGKESLAADKVDAPMRASVLRVQEYLHAFDDAVERELELIDQMRERIAFLRQGAQLSGEDREAWDKKRMSRMMAEQLLRMGGIESASKLVEDSGTRGLVDLALYESARKVVLGLEAHETAPLLAWCMEHKSKLRRIDSKLEVSARIQEAIECMRRNDKRAALAVIKRHVGTATETQWPKEVVKVMGLIACGSKTTIGPFQSMLSDARWTDLIQIFQRDFKRVYQLPDQSAFSAVLQTGLCASRTPSCTSTDTNRCAACLPSVFALGEGLPYAHVGNSRLLCSHTGRPLNEDNAPFLLESGYVYGQKDLKKLRVGDMIRCPRSESEFPASSALRLFIL